MSAHVTGRARARSLGIATALLATLVGVPASAQTTIDRRREGLGLVYERWSFGDGLPMRGNDLDAPRVESVTQLSIPLSVVVPLGERWRFDLAGAYAKGEVRLDRTDTTLGVDRYALDGPSDIKLRVVGDLVPDRLLLTLGVTAPTGTTKLDREQFRAVQVLGAPALRFNTPTLGSGFGATAGLVAARELGRWAVAFGTSYELRGKYAPIEALALAADDPELDPGDAVHMSLGFDGLIGRNRSSLALTSDFYTSDKLHIDFGTGSSESDYKLGPTLGAEWRLDLATTRLRALSIVVADRYRSAFKDASGETVDGSSGNEIAGAVVAVIPTAARAGLSLGLDARHHSGLSVDDTPATAAARVFGATAGLVFDGRLAALRPWVRFQAGSLESAGERVSGTGLGAGLLLEATF